MSVPPPRLDDLLKKIASGESLDLYEDLGLDSFGAMEFCIHLELETSLVVTPEDIAKLKSSKMLVKVISSH